MRVSPVFEGQFLVERRREQRVREADQALGVLDHVCGERRLQCVPGDARPTEQGRRGTAERRHERQGLARRPRQTGQPAAHEPLQALRYGKRLCRISSRALGIERAGELECVERVAA